jgi:hypothetical protein
MRHTLSYFFGAIVAWLCRALVAFAREPLSISRITLHGARRRRTTKPASCETFTDKTPQLQPLIRPESSASALIGALVASVV